MQISIIGAGNVATQLALALRKSGHEIVQIYNRSNDAGLELSKTVGASFTSDASKLAEADIYILAVKDDVIKEVADGLTLHNKIVVHTSGTKPKSLLQHSSPTHGIFYPLQTMTKNSVLNFSGIPILIEATDEHTIEILHTLALSLTKNVHRVTEEQRQWIHVAAVFANNFTNHLYTIAEELLNKHELSLDILRPLIAQTAENIKAKSPATLQTGPAARNDLQTIEKHLELLQPNQQAMLIYKEITDSIRKHQHKP
jgi:predicted short-subunit dehydrogenase-like oxidoreductase (DUF2520 family)